MNQTILGPLYAAHKARTEDRPDTGIQEDPPPSVSRRRSVETEASSAGPAPVKRKRASKYDIVPNPTAFPTITTTASPPISAPPFFDQPQYEPPRLPPIGTSMPVSTTTNDRLYQQWIKESSGSGNSSATVHPMSISSGQHNRSNSTSAGGSQNEDYQSVAGALPWENNGIQR